VGFGDGLGLAVGLGRGVNVGSALPQALSRTPSSSAAAISGVLARRCIWRMIGASSGSCSERAGWYAAIVDSREIEVRTDARGVFDLTDACAAFVAEVAAGRDGLLHVFVPHATAGVVVMELGAGSDDDLLAALDELLPRDERWRHRHGSPGHGADHLLPLLVSPSLSVPVAGGSMTLGTWQSIALVDPNPDNARRLVRLSFLSG
jgi:secondary thiamine-phosphate synthase enzyme